MLCIEWQYVGLIHDGKKDFMAVQFFKTSSEESESSRCSGRFRRVGGILGKWCHISISSSACLPRLYIVTDTPPTPCHLVTSDILCYNDRMFSRCYALRVEPASSSVQITFYGQGRRSRPRKFPFLTEFGARKALERPRYALRSYV